MMTRASLSPGGTSIGISAAALRILPRQRPAQIVEQWDRRHGQRHDDQKRVRDDLGDDAGRDRGGHGDKGEFAARTQQQGGFDARGALDGEGLCDEPEQERP